MIRSVVNKTITNNLDLCNFIDTGSMAEAHTEIADIQSASDKDTRRVQNGINRVEARIKQLETTVNRIETMLDKYIQAVDRSDNRT